MGKDDVGFETGSKDNELVKIGERKPLSKEGIVLETMGNGLYGIHATVLHKHNGAMLRTGT